MNTIILAGKVIDIDKNNNQFHLEVERNYRNNEGFNDADTFLCKPWRGMNTFLSSYLAQEDVLIIKGQLNIINNEYVVLIDQFTIMYRQNKKINAL